MGAIAESAVISRIILSTDDPDLIETANQYSNIECDQRPTELATDETTSADVIRYIVRNKNLQHCRIILLQLTSPFRTGADITALLHQMEKSKASSGVSVCRWRSPPSPPFGTATDRATLGPECVAPGKTLSDLQNQAWAVNGAIYIFDPEVFMRTGKLYDARSAIHIMEPWRSIDIDYEDDVKIADAIAHHHCI
tara:strand:- start:2172 stop:2756 length:585 start_codon:yes stop_codon:yes gene_type:complete